MPDKILCDETKRKINTGEFEGCTDVHVIANLIKVFFHELPVSLYNHVPDSTITAVSQLPIDDVDDAILNFVQCENNSILLWLLDLLAFVVFHEEDNKMSVENLAIGFEFFLNISVISLLLSILNIFCLVMSPSMYMLKSGDVEDLVLKTKTFQSFTAKILAYRIKTKHNYQTNEQIIQVESKALANGMLDNKDQTFR